jgi:hypothetical protein
MPNWLRKRTLAAIKAEYGFTDLVAVVQEWVDFPLPKFTAIVRTEQMDQAVGR